MTTVLNSTIGEPASTPFGGFEQSGFGRELRMDALSAYGEAKNVFYATAE